MHVPLARHLTEHGKGPHAGRVLAMHVGMNAGMGDHQLTAIQQQMVRQAVDKGRDLTAEIVALAAELGDRGVEPVAHLHIAPGQPAAELVVMIADHAIARPGLHQMHGQAHHVRRARSAIDQIAQQDRLAALGMADAIVA